MTYRDINKALNFMLINIKHNKLDVFDSLELIASIRNLKLSLVDNKIGG